MVVFTAFLAVFMAGVWAWQARSWDAYAALAAAIAVLAAALWQGKRKSGVKMSQRVGDGSVAIQSGRDTRVGGSTGRQDDPHV
jgi:hypothetical protein